jgi:hypothetical protein
LDSAVLRSAAADGFDVVELYGFADAALLLASHAQRELGEVSGALALKRSASDAIVRGHEKTRSRRAVRLLGRCLPLPHWAA